jgi:hypothetical protein
VAETMLSQETKGSEYGDPFAGGATAGSGNGGCAV